MPDSVAIKLIVGLGNPGEKYADTLHNAGFQFVDLLADKYSGTFRQEKRFFGEYCQMNVGAQECRLLKPMTFMNRSGQAVAAICNFYKLKAQELLIVHDELDLEPGVIRLKQAGGHGGHNGLRDIHKAIGPEYNRLRIGIGHPGDKSQVSNYVLKRGSKAVTDKISGAIQRAIDETPAIITGEFQQVMNRLH